MALFIRWPLYPLIEGSRPYLTLFGGVAFAVWYCRWQPAALAAFVGFLAANYFLAAPPGALVLNAAFIFELAGYALSCGLIILFGEAMHRATEREFRERNLLATTLASIGDGVLVTDVCGRVTFLNAEAERLTGWKNADAAGQPVPEVFRIVNEESRKLAENPVDKVLRFGTVVGLANHTILIAKNGSETPIDDSAAPIKQADGSLSGVVLVFRDFTEQRNAQRAHSRLAAIVQSSGDAIITKSLDGVIQTWNSSAERLFGYKPDEIIGKPVATLIPPGALHEEEQVLNRLRGGQTYERVETIRVSKDGRHIPVLLSVSPLKDGEGRVVGASKIIHDFTDLVAAREALAKEKELLATTLASIGDAVIVTDEEGCVTFLNGEAERLTGWNIRDAAGRPLPEVFRIVNEETRQTVENPVEKVLRLGNVVGLANHTVLLSRDGREIPIDDSAAPIRQPGGRLFGVVLVFRDFTEHKAAEAALRNAHEQLAHRAVHLEKLVEQRTAKLNETVGDLETFSYSIVHDMRSPLRAMQGFAQILVEECSPISETANNYVRRIQTAAARLDQLIQDGLNYSRLIRVELRLVPVDLEALLRGMVESYPTFHPSHAQIELCSDFPRVNGNEAALTQCLSNLLGNAVKFVAPGVTPRIRVWSETRDGWVRIFVRDNGIGIESEAHERIFQMFQRLSKQYEGTGIGLAIVKKGVERMGGKVGLDSEPGVGSTFWLELARADDTAHKQ